MAEACTFLLSAEAIAEEIDASLLQNLVGDGIQVGEEEADPVEGSNEVVMSM